jgi:intergrase/recombinase
LKKYRSLFKRGLEGRELSEELIEWVARHPNGWLRNIFRHYVRYLYHRRRISGETMAWILEVVPSRSYRLDVRVYPVNMDELGKTLEYLRQHHAGYYALYRLMLESGARLEHALRMLAGWRPEEQVEIPGYGFTERLVCFPEKGFCRYYLGLREGNKPCEWLYFSRETLMLLQDAGLPGKQLRRELVSRYARRHGLVRPKYLRKIAWQLMRKTMGYEAAAFAQSRFGELRVSERRYSDLLGGTDQVYLKYLKFYKASIALS